MERRHYGLDWLRIGAFGLLIFYHIGMVFVPWEFHIKTEHPLAWVEWPMQALNPWRLGLLFLISGVASRFLLGKLGSLGAFVGSRSRRLLVPLAAGMAIWVTPQAWVQLRESAGYAHGFGWFWSHDYFAFAPVFARPGFKGLTLPTWNHLWFVVYLWIYTLIGVALALAFRGRGQAMFERLFGGWRLFVLPALWIAAVRAWASPAFPETHALVGDWAAHAFYLPFFLFGLGLARSEPMLARAARAWCPLLIAGVAGYAMRMTYNTLYAGDAVAPDWADWLALAGRAAQTWGPILGLVGLATAHLNVDAPARAWLTRAVFPFYIAHQTIIIVVEHWLKPMRIGSTAEFLVLLPVTVAGCLAFALIGERAGVLRPLFGLAGGTPSPAPVRGWKIGPPGGSRTRIVP